MEIKNSEDKKLKFNERVGNVKEFLSDKRNKAIVKLALYFIFFLIIIIFVRISNSRNNNYSNYEPEALPQSITESVKSLQNMYNYNITINYEIIDTLTNNYVINLKNENNIKELIYNSITYYHDDYGWYQLTNETKEYINFSIFNELSLIEPNKLYNYLFKAVYQYKKEDLNNNISINSNLSINDFALINNNIINSSENISIETVENNNQIKEIYLDLTNYYKINNPNIYLYKIKIIFNNKN